MSIMINFVGRFYLIVVEFDYLSVIDILKRYSNLSVVIVDVLESYLSFSFVGFDFVPKY